MNKCCFKVFEILVNNFKKELRSRLVWEGDFIFYPNSRHQCPKYRTYSLGDFEIFESTGRKRKVKIFLSGVDITKALKTDASLAEARDFVEGVVLKPFRVKESEVVK